MSHISASGTTYLSCADTAKLVRKALKAEFPGVKFSVRSSTYSGGASIHIGWTDGPTERRVKQTVWRYEGATFDGMIDLKSYTEDVPLTADEAKTVGFKNPELVSMGADFVLCQRDISAEWYAEIAAEIERLSGQPCDLSVTTFRRDKQTRRYVSEGYNGGGWDALYAVCVCDGQLCRYAGTECGRSLVHQYTSGRERA